MTENSVISSAYMAIDITDNDNFATVLDQHVKVDMKMQYRQPTSQQRNGSLLLTPIHLPGIGEYCSTRPKGPYSAPHSMV